MNGFPSALQSGVYNNTKRVKVDAQPTSFEENAQFRLFQPFDAVSYTTGAQIVYKFTTSDPINVISRNINIAVGGRKYRVYRNEGITFTGTLAPVSATPMNNNTADTGDAHPQTRLVIEKAIGAGIFSASSDPVTGVTLVTDGNANRSSSVYAAGYNQFGIAGDSVYWVVFDHFGANNDTTGEYELIYEERFGE